MNIRQKVKTYIGLFCFMLGLLQAGQALSAEDPVEMLRGVTQRVMTELRTHRNEIRSNRNKIYTLVNHLIVPYVDFTEMSRWVVGRNAWKETDPETRDEFVKEFKNLVIGSYAGSLLGYTDQQIEFLPLRVSPEDQERIQVSSLIKENGKAPLHLDYRLIRQGGSWKVYDIIVEGVSLAQGYRAQFSEDVRNGGVATVIESMKKHNAR